jgi:hypothetical protein
MRFASATPVRLNFNSEPMHGRMLPSLTERYLFSRTLR